MTAITDTSTTAQPSRQRMAAGRALRANVPRTSHAAWNPPADRFDPVAVLVEQNESRLPELVPVRMGRMIESAFAFYRGTAILMARDLVSTPNTGVAVHSCGDAHLMNFGMFASPERTLLFDINDFDETSRAPWEWDVKRLAVSMTLAARDAGFTVGEARTATLAAVRSYREKTREFAAMGSLDLYYTKIDDAAAVSVVGSQREKVRERAVNKARSRNSIQAMTKLTVMTSEGRIRIAEQPPLIVHPPIADDLAAVNEIIEQYRMTLRADVQHVLKGFEVIDVALKVVGVGSVGTRCFIVLMLDSYGSPLFLQVKEAGQSVLESTWTTPDYGSGDLPVSGPGERVVVGQQIMQSSSDPFLGWLPEVRGAHYYVRQFRDMKWSVDLTRATPTNTAEYGALCGWSLARGHAQSGHAATIAGYLGGGATFDEAVADFAAAYADQAQADYAALLAAVNAGDIEVQTGL